MSRDLTRPLREAWIVEAVRTPIGRFEGALARVRPDDLAAVAVAAAVEAPVSRIKELNPHLLTGVTPPGEPFGIRVPPGQSPLVVASLGNRWRVVRVDD